MAPLHVVDRLELEAVERDSRVQLVLFCFRML